MKTYFGACVAGCLALAVIVSGARPVPEPGSAAVRAAQHAHGSMARHGSTPWLLRAMSAEACIPTLTTVPQCSTAPSQTL